MKNIHILKDFFQIIITLSLTMFASIPSFADDICEQYVLDEEGCLSNAQCEWIPPYTCKLMENIPTNPTNPSNPDPDPDDDNDGGNSDINAISVMFVDQNFQSCGNVVIDPINCTSFEIPKCNNKTVLYWYESYSGSEDDSIHSDQTTICDYMKDVLENNGNDASTIFRFVELPDSFTCEPGTYTKFENSRSCESTCTIGHYCPGGEFAPDTIEKDSIKECYVGSYQDETGQSDCKKCAPGTYQDDYGATSCKICAAGSYTPDDEYYYPSCIKCPSGTYQTATKSSSCKNCTKPAAASFKSDETGIYHNNGCSWSMPICPANHYYDTTSKACSACPIGYYNNLKSKVSSSNVMCYQYGRGLDLCKSSTDYTAVQFPDSYTASNLTTCTPNTYNIYAYLVADTANVIKQAYDAKLTYSSASGGLLTSYANPIETILKNNVPEKYTYLWANNTKFDIYSQPVISDNNKLGKVTLSISSSNQQININSGDIDNIKALPNNSNIYIHIPITGKPYNVYMISSGVTDSGPGNTFNIDTNPIVQKKFGSEPSDGVTPNKSLVTTCISGTNYAYIPDTATPKYYECTNTNQTASKVTNTSNGSAAMFEPSKPGNNICIAYQMTTCDAGYSCNSCQQTACNNGKYQPKAGQASCETCPAGTVSANDNLRHTSCTNCYNGQYQPNAGQASCETCPSGSYTTNEDKANYECEGCDAGTYYNETKNGCDPCPAGTYQPYKSQTTCFSCQDGIAQEKPEATSGLFTTEIINDIGATARNQCYINPMIIFTDLHGSSQPLSNKDRIYWRSTP